MTTSCTGVISGAVGSGALTAGAEQNSLYYLLVFGVGRNALNRTFLSCGDTCNMVYL